MYMIEGSVALLSAVEKEYTQQGLTHERITPNTLLVHVNPYTVLNKNASLYRALIDEKLRAKKLNQQEVTKILNFKDKVKVEKGRKIIVIKRNKDGTIKERKSFSKWVPDKEALVGKKVKVTKGEFEGLNGIVQEVNTEKGTARVMFSVFGIPHVETIKLEYIEGACQE